MKPVPLRWFPWNGSKRRLLPALETLLRRYLGSGRYFEPFVGSGAVSHLVKQLRPKLPQVLSDRNPWLIAAFKGQLAKTDVTLPDTVDFEAWRNIRDQDLDRLTVEDQALRFAVCLFTAWGNRWKTEADGHFTPSSTPVNPKFCQSAALRQRLNTFFQVRWLGPEDTAQCSDWTEALTQAQPGDLVYLDPPYPEHLGYGSQIWTISNMLDTIDWIGEANRKGIFVVASNVADLERLYKRAGLETQIVELGSASNTRRARREVLAWNLPTPVGT